VNVNPILEQVRRAEVLGLIQLWELCVDGQCPTEQQFAFWLQLHTFERMVQSVREVGRKQARRRVKMDADHVVRFCSRVANDRAREERAA
jgi:hypothetical protein